MVQSHHGPATVKGSRLADATEKSGRRRKAMNLSQETCV
jgi:hypothetical protein